jgi:hypothetical protein
MNLIEPAIRSAGAHIDFFRHEYHPMFICEFNRTNKNSENVKVNFLLNFSIIQ